MGMRRRWATFTVAVGLVLGALAVSGSAEAARSAPAAGWGPVRNLSAPVLPWALIPASTAMDSRGNTLALWLHTGPGGAPLMAAYRPSGGQWRRPVAVPGSAGADEQARVAFDGAGNATVAWVSGRQVAVVRRPSSGSWGRPVRLYLSPKGNEGALPAALDLAVNARGRSVVTWSSNGVKAVTGSGGGTWGRVHGVGKGGGGDVVIDRWGRATLVWGEGGWAGRVMTASRDVGEAWTKPRPITPTIFFYGAVAAVRPNGEVDVLVQSPAGNRPGFQVLRKPRDGRWVKGPKLRLGGEPWKPRMGVDAAGNVTAAWANLQTGALWRVGYSPSAGWSKKVRVTRPGTAGDDYWLAVNGAGNALFGWTAKGGAHSVQAVVRTASGRWQVHPRTVSSGRGEARGPVLAVGAGGDAVMVWTFRPAGSSVARIQARHHRG